MSLISDGTMLFGRNRSSQMSLIVCRLIIDRGATSAAWTYASGSASMLAREGIVMNHKKLLRL